MKILKIDTCSECNHLGMSDLGGITHHCKNDIYMRTVTRFPKTAPPDWCPLEDAEKDDKK